MLVNDWMTTNPETCSPETIVFDAIERMSAGNIGSMLIVSREEKLLGIFTERDLMIRVVSKGLMPKEISIQDVMTANPDTVKPSDDIVKVYRKLLMSTYRHMPVTEGEKAIGIISIRTPHLADLLIVAEYHLGQTKDAARITQVVRKDFEEELDHYAKDEFGSKIYKEYRTRDELKVLTGRLRDEFKIIYKNRTGKHVT